MELDYFPNGVAERRPLIYFYEIVKPCGTVVHKYVGKAKTGTRRAIGEYVCNVTRWLNGASYRKSNPDGFRWIHRKLGVAVLLGRTIRLTLLENCSVEELCARERHWQRVFGCPPTRRRKET